MHTSIWPSCTHTLTETVCTWTIITHGSACTKTPITGIGLMEKTQTSMVGDDTNHATLIPALTSITATKSNKTVLAPFSKTKCFFMTSRFTSNHMYLILVLNIFPVWYFIICNIIHSVRSVRPLYLCFCLGSSHRFNWKMVFCSPIRN